MGYALALIANPSKVKRDIIKNINTLFSAAQDFSRCLDHIGFNEYRSIIAALQYDPTKAGKHAQGNPLSLITLAALFEEKHELNILVKGLREGVLKLTDHLQIASRELHIAGGRPRIPANTYVAYRLWGIWKDATAHTARRIYADSTRDRLTKFGRFVQAALAGSRNISMQSLDNIIRGKNPASNLTLF